MMGSMEDLGALELCCFCFFGGEVESLKFGLSYAEK